MPEIKKKVGLVCTKISFTEFSIVYHVKYEGNIIREGVVCCADDIDNKDLILKPTIVTRNNMRVIFTPSVPTSLFYAKILSKNIKDYDEHFRKLKNIYLEGDIVGYIL